MKNEPPTIQAKISIWGLLVTQKYISYLIIQKNADLSFIGHI